MKLKDIKPLSDKVVKVSLLVGPGRPLLEGADQFLTEARFEEVPGTNIMSRYDPPNTNTVTDAHYHFIQRGNEICAVNVSGTAHHKSNRGYEVPRKVADFLASKGVELPSDRILEVVDLEPEVHYTEYLLEFSDRGAV